MKDRFLVLDTETTGLSHEKDRVVEIAVVPTERTQPVPGRGVSCLVNPGIPIPPEASAIHHLVDADVAGAQPLLDVLAKITNAVTKFKWDAIVAHNAPFDRGFVPNFLPGVPWLDTARMAKRYLPDAGGFSNSYLRYYLKLSVPEVVGMAAHRATVDAIVTAALFRYLVGGPAKEDFDRLTIREFADLCDSPVLLRIVGFGKHKGAAWADVPSSYLEWLLRSATEADKDTLFTAEHYLRERNKK